MTARSAARAAAPLRIAWLTYRIQHFEWTIVVGATILSVLVSAIVAAWIRSAGFDQCLTDDAINQSLRCQAGIAPWLFKVAETSRSLVPIFPLVAGLLLGGPVVARELETGTARLAWSLGPSRLRWFVHRAVPALVVVTLAGLAIGATADALLHLTRPELEIDRTFVSFRFRGLLVAVNALVVASIALAVGSILGRMVPTLILSLVLVGALAQGVDKIETQLLTNEALTTTEFDYSKGDYYLDSRIRDKDGETLTFEEFARRHPDLNEVGYNPEEYPNVTLYIPGSRYHEIEQREAGVLIVIAGLFVLLATGAVVARQPR